MKTELDTTAQFGARLLRQIRRGETTPAGAIAEVRRWIEICDGMYDVLQGISPRHREYYNQERHELRQLLRRFVRSHHREVAAVALAELM